LAAVAAALAFPLITAAGPIHDAVEAGDVAKVKELLAENATVVNATTPGGSTPLHSAVGTKNPEMVQVLLDAGANVKAVTREGFTPLHWAAYMNATNVAALLLAKGADPDARTQAGLSAFQIAVKENAKEMTAFLADRTGAAYKEAFLDDSFAQGEQAVASGDMARAYAIFNDLLRKDPGNEQVNFALGMVCRSLRDYSRAEITFDRILQTNPNNDRARFELGRVYLDRGQYAAAGQEFRKVLASKRPMGDKVRAEVEQLLARADAGTKKWSVTGRVDIGGFYDDNVNVGPDSESISISPIIFGAQTIESLTIDEGSRPAKAPGAFASGVISAVYDMGAPREWAASFAGAYYQNWLQDERGHESDYYRVSSGLGYRGGRSLLDMSISAGHIDNGHEPLVNMFAFSPGFRCVGGARADWQWTTAGTVEYRDYDTLNDRDGVYVAVGETLKRFTGARRHTVSMGIVVSHDYTDEAVYENTAIEWNFGAEFRLPWASTLYGRMRYIDSSYNEQETLAPDTRSDRQTQFTVGLNKLITRRWGVDVNHQVTDNSSTFGLYTYDRNVTTISTFCTF